MSNLTIDKIISDIMNEHLVNKQIRIKPKVFEGIVDYLKFCMATEYLKATSKNPMKNKS